MSKHKQPWLADVVRRDAEFLRNAGIEPCPLDDPFARCPTPEETPWRETPPFTTHDEKWLSSCGTTWEPEPELGFRSLSTSLEYVAKYPGRIRATVEETFNDLMIMLPQGHTFNDFLQEVIADFVQGSKEGDDLARVCANSRPPKPGACKSAHFHALVKHWVEGIAMTLYPPPIPGLDSTRDEEE